MVREFYCRFVQTLVLQFQYRQSTVGCITHSIDVYSDMSSLYISTLARQCELVEKDQKKARSDTVEMVLPIANIDKQR
jgi:hypothetical protein